MFIILTLTCKAMIFPVITIDFPELLHQKTNDLKNFSSLFEGVIFYIKFLRIYLTNSIKNIYIYSNSTGLVNDFPVWKSNNPELLEKKIASFWCYVFVRRGSFLPSNPRDFSSYDRARVWRANGSLNCSQNISNENY